MTHDREYLDSCDVEALHLMMLYLNERMEETEDNLRHARRLGSRDLLTHYGEWEDLLRCMMSEVAFHIHKRETLDGRP